MNKLAFILSISNNIGLITWFRLFSHLQRTEITNGAMVSHFKNSASIRSPVTTSFDYISIVSPRFIQNTDTALFNTNLGKIYDWKKG